MTLRRGPSTSTLRSKPLGEILREQGSISLDQLSQALEYQRAHGGLLGQILVRMKACNPEALGEALQKQIKITDIKLAQAQIRISAATLLGRSFCEENKLIPFETLGKLLCIAMANPLNRNCIISVEKSIADLQIKTFRCPWPDIHKTIDRAFAAAEEKKSRIQAAVQLDADGNPISGPITPQPIPVANRASRPLSGLNRTLGNASGQPGFELPPSVRPRDPDTAPTASTSMPAVASATATPKPAAAQPVRPKTAPTASAVRTAIAPVETEVAIDDSWIDTKQNPHVVFHQRMLKTFSQIGGAPGFLGRQIPDEQRQKMLITLGFLIAEHGTLLRDSTDFTLAPESLKQLDWKALVIRGHFCYHTAFPYVFGDLPKAFHLYSLQDATEMYEKVRGHFKLFIKEINGIRNHPSNLVHCNQLEVDDTTAHLDRIYLLLTAG